MKSVFCPWCELSGQTSTVFEGMSCCTAAYTPPYFDATGRRHNHDGNATTTSYNCSRGHQFTERSYPQCWCGWTAQPIKNIEINVTAEDVGLDDIPMSAGFDLYQESARVFDCGIGDLTVHVIGLGEEAGEVLGKFKKARRDQGDLSNVDKEAIEKELGDVLWYIAAIASDLGLSLGKIADRNLAKLQDRTDRGTMQGSGDDR